MVKQCTLQKKIDLNDFREKYAKKAMPLFAIDPKITAHCFNEEQFPTMDEGWKILSLGYNGNSEE